MRGLFGNCNRLFVTIGLFLSYMLGTPWGNSKFLVGFSNSALVAAGIVTLFEFLMLFTYETPRWLYSKGHNYLGKRVLSILRGPRHRHHIENEIERIKAALRSRIRISVIEQLLEFNSLSILLPVILVSLLMFFQQFSGINAAIFYSASIFNSSGYNVQQSNYIAVGLSGVQIVATFISVVLIDLLGRRVLLTISSIGIVLSSFTMGVFFYIYKEKCDSCLGPADIKCHREADFHSISVCETESFGFLAIVSLIIFVGSFSLGWGPIPWSSMSELLPTRVRSLAGSVTAFINWTFAVIITVAFQHYSEKVTPAGTWWSFSFVMLLSIVFVILFLPETKGRTLEEIQQHFERGQILAISFGKKSHQNIGQRAPFSSRASITDVD